MTDTKEPEIEVLPAPRRAASRRVFSVEEKRSMVEEAQRPSRSGRAALQALDAFEATWGKSHPAVVASWRRNWERVRPFFAFPKEVRRILYTTNAIESLNYQLRKIIRSKGHFPSDDTASKLLYLALRNAEKKWHMPPQTWKSAMNQFQIHFEGRIPA